ncbi:MAG: hypothetical protein Q9M97_02480 [Candidatus Gracilibacteria bacterium]|nr:hypothetical protein [Candidatus Gracilibacteria bacterium]
MIAILFLFLAVLSIITDTKSVFGNKLFSILNQGFGEYYKIIFSPVLILLSIFILWKEKINFNLLKFLGLIFFYISFTKSFFGFFIENYSAIFDFSKYGNTYFGEGATIFILIISFVLSLVILFRFSPIEFTKNIVNSTTDFINSRRNNEDNNYEEFEENKNSSKSRLEVKKENKAESKLEQKKAEISRMLEELKIEKDEIKRAKKDADEKNNGKLKICLKK